MKKRKKREPSVARLARAVARLREAIEELEERVDVIEMDVSDLEPAWCEDEAAEAAGG